MADLGRSIDRAIAVVAPQWAARRAQARGMLDGFDRARDHVRRYEAATLGRRGANWITSSSSIDSELRGSLSRLRARSRDLTQNNAWASSAVNSLQTDLVGTGIVWSPRSTEGDEAKLDQAVDSKLRRLWLPWIESKACDLRGRRNFYSLQSIGARELVEGGEFLVRRVWTNERPVPFRLLFLEADHLDTMKDGYTLADGNRIVQGVEYNPYGRAVAYWLFRDHPGDVGSIINLVSERVPASDVLHVFEEVRYGQTRGLPRGTSCMLKLRDVDEFEDAQLVKQKVAACFVGFVHDLTADGGGLGNVLGELDANAATPAAGEGTTRKFTPGMFQGLPAGKTISFGQPPTIEGYADFVTINLRAVSQAYEVTYERLTGDLRNTNYSSARIGAIKYNGALDRTTWHTLVPDLCDGVFGWFRDAMVLLGELPPTVGAEWTAPIRPLVDPTKDVPAAIKAVRAGFKTRSECVRELGRNPIAIEREFVEENARADAAELSFDSDGRRPEQAPAQPEKPEKAASGVEDDD